MKNTKIYNELVQKMRTFFQAKGFLEVPTQSRLSILAACENPHSITKFEYSGQIWPLPQTGQMWLEVELLKNPEWDGVFCITTSYRQEKNPIPGRHDLIFPMFEVETKGTKDDMVKLQAEYSEDFNNNQTDFKVDQFRSKTTFRPIKRKLRFRRASPRCPGF